MARHTHIFVIPILLAGSPALAEPVAPATPASAPSATAPAPDAATATPATAPAPDAAKAAPAAESNSGPTSMSSYVGSGMGVVCVPPLGMTHIEGDEVEYKVDVRVDSGDRVDLGEGGARIGLSSHRKHRVRLYAGETLVQEFNVELSKYSRPYLKLKKKEGGFEAWVLRSMRSGHCPYPDLAAIAKKNAKKAKGG